MSELPNIIFGVDSATLTIPLSKVEFPDSWLSSEVATVNLQTGEARDIREASNEYIKDRGISTRYQVQKRAFVPNTNSQIDVLRITINAKQLGARYLEGITATNVARVYEYIISQGLVNLSLDDFLAGWVTDCDFKLDFHLADLKEVYTNIDALHERTRETLKAKGRGVYKPFRDTGRNYGLEWYPRNNWKGAVPASKQNTRVYAKGLELTHHSSEFYANFLPAQDHTLNILRIETQGIKNAKTAKRYEIEDTSLLNVLSLTSDSCKRMFTEPFSHFLNFDYKPPKVKDSHSFKEYENAVLKKIVMEAMDINLDELWEMLGNGYENDVRPFKDKVEKSKQKRAHMERYHNLFNQTPDSMEMQSQISSRILPFVNPALGLS